MDLSARLERDIQTGHERESEMAEKKKKASKPRKRLKNGQIKEKPEYLDKTEEGGGSSSGSPDLSEGSRTASVLMFCGAVLVLLLAIIPGTSGWNAIHGFLLGVFGISVFVSPVIFLFTSWMISKGEVHEDYSSRGIWAIVLTLAVSAAFQIFAQGSIPGEGLLGMISGLYEQGKELEGGGCMSLLLAGLLLKIFGRLGARIVVILCLFAFLVLLSGKSIPEFFVWIVQPLKKLGKSLDGIHSVVMGGDYEYGYEGRDDMEDIDPEPDVIAVEELPPEPDRSVPEPVQEDAADEWEYVDDPEYLADAEAFAMLGAAPPPRRKRKKRRRTPPEPEQNAIGNELDVQLPSEAVPDEDLSASFGGGVDDAIDMLVSRAAEESAADSDTEDEKTAAEDSFDDIDYSDISTGEQQEIPYTPVYILPTLDLLALPDNTATNQAALQEMSDKSIRIKEILKSFGVEVRVKNISRGPSITRYDIQPGAGVKIAKIKNLSADIALGLAASGVRISPVPGDTAIGIEVPNINRDTVTLREILASNEFRNSRSKLAFAVGKDIAGNAIVGDITKLPHVIIAGTTGSGKSVCTRSIIMSILYNATPEEVKIILIDPKIVEFKVFTGIPHLLIPIVTEAKKAAGALNWAVNEMMRRYTAFAEVGANDLRSYNEFADDDEYLPKMPQIVIFIDELADMMLVAKSEVEDSICRLAQMGRAAGIHLVVATQRPTTDVITGLIKANIPSRIALSVMSQVDSRTIIDTGGADKLLGNGDMLYMPIGFGEPLRVQGCFASPKEISDTIRYIRLQQESEYDSSIIEAVDSYTPQTKNTEKEVPPDLGLDTGSDGDMIIRAAEVAVMSGQLSTSMLQRKLKLGFSRAARIVDELEELGVVGPNEGARPRKVLMSKIQFDEWKLRRLNG